MHPQGENIMNDKSEIFGKYEDDSGEEYYCPLNAVSGNNIVSESELDSCVEASTAGRYSGIINVVDRFAT